MTLRYTSDLINLFLCSRWFQQFHGLGGHKWLVPFLQCDVILPGIFLSIIYGHLFLILYCICVILLLISYLSAILYPQQLCYNH